jgi:hypothetical protein
MAMIRFIDLGIQISCDPEGDRHFTFFDTITDTFIRVNDEQIWTAWIDFEEDFMKMLQDPDVDSGFLFAEWPANQYLKRLKSLCPQWVFE